MFRQTRAVLYCATLFAASPVLAADYFYTGTVDLAATPYTTADRIFLNAATATASAPVSIPTSLFRFNSPSTVANAQDITLTGALDGASFTKSGTATLILAGDSPTYGSTVTLSAGTLRLASANALVTPALGPASYLALNPNSTLDLNGFSTSRTIQYNGGALVNDNITTPVNLPAGPALTGTYVLGGAGDLTFNSQLFSSGSFTKIGPGTVTVTNPANNGNYYGTFYVNGGTLRFANAGAFGNPNTGAIWLNPTGTVDLNGTSVYKSYNFAGGTLVNNNTASPVTLTSSNFYATGSPTGNVNFGGAGDITLATWVDSNAFPLIKTGPGTLTLAASAYTTGAQVLAGTLRVNDPGFLPQTGATTVLPGGALDVNGFSSSSFSGLVYRPVTLAGGALVNNNTATPVTISPPSSPITFAGPGILLGGAGDMTFNGSLSSTQSLTKIGAGTLTLSSPNNHTGGTTLLAGTTVISGDFQLGSFAAAITIADGLLRNTATATVSRPITLSGTLGGFDTCAPLTLTRSLTGAGALHKYGSSSLTIISFTTIGPLAVHQGTLTIAQGTPVVSAISVDPGATLSLTPSRLFIDVAPGDPLPLDSVRSLLFNGRNGGDWLGTGGIISSRLNATNDPARTHALAYADGSLLPDTLRQFPTLPPPGITTIDTSSLLIRYTLYGDANLDGLLNADDYALLDRSYALSLPNPYWTDGDFNYDGLVDQADYLLIDTTLGQTQGLSPAFLSQRESQFGADYVSQLLVIIPEPSSLACLFAALLPLTRRRRYQK